MASNAPEEISLPPSPPPIPHHSRPSSDAHGRRAPTASSSTTQDSQYTPFGRMISGSAGRPLGAAATGLEELRGVLEAANALPFVKYLASVGVQLLRYVIDMQITNDEYKNLAFRARDMIVAVARSCNGRHVLAAELESDLRQLTSTMDSILFFATERASRGTLKKLWSKSDDVAMVKALDKQLTHSFNIFQIQSNVTSRISQEQILMNVTRLHLSPPVSPSIMERCLRVQEGVYVIHLEIEDFKSFGDVHSVHVFMAPHSDSPLQTQLWSIQRNTHEHSDYTIRSLATGYVLNILFASNTSGAKVGGYPWKPADGNAKWSFWGTTQGPFGDHCTIRSNGLHTVLDGVCPKDPLGCNDLHATRIADVGHSLSQEWQLVPLSCPFGLHDAENVISVVPTFPRRRILLQNVQTGLFATRKGGGEGPNVVLSVQPQADSAWSICYADNTKLDRFMILSTSAHPFSLDHWDGRYINAGKYLPESPHHLWIPIARDGAFILRNSKTNELLAARDNTVHTLPLGAHVNTACHWRLIDAMTREHIRVWYDSALSIVPPEVAGPRTHAAQVASRLPLLQTMPVSLEAQLALLNSFHREHEIIRTMLEEGYKAIVYAPRVIAGWREVEVRTVRVEDEDAAFKWSQRGLQPCA
ncbi:unnamed protein product [Peniophora sp. CBMAI 1063]|nr:unnamed protein product [Peniophora sp. CBMAI 1063]